MIYKIQKTKGITEIHVLNRVAEMEAERYKRVGDYSVTDLINPVRVVHLKKRHGHEVTVRPESMISSMLGTAVHNYFEKYLSMWIDKYDYKHYELEKRLKHTVQVPIIGGKVEPRVITGQYDIRDDKDLYDLKTAKTWKLVFDPDLIDYHEQQNFYRLLIMKEQGINIDTLNVIALYKDWQIGNALRDRSYPQQQMMEYQLTKWDLGDTEELMHSRIQALVNTEMIEDDQLLVCSREERWERHKGSDHAIHYAILKNRFAKRATKVIKGGNLDDAIQVAQGMKGMTAESLVEIRYARPKRCVDYCDVNEFCSFYQDWKKRNEEGKINEYIKFKA